MKSGKSKIPDYNSNPPEQSGVISQTSFDAQIKIREWVLSGASYALIEDAIAQQWPDIQSRPALLVVMNEVMDNYNQPKDMLLGWCLESTKELYRKLVSIGDFANALRALKEYRAIIEKKETSISDLLKNG